MLSVKKSQTSEAQMMIRKSSIEVYKAFIDPEITKNFWFTKSSGKLALGKEVTWTWEMYKHSGIVVATELIPAEKITIEWYGPSQPTIVEIAFKTLGFEKTLVSIRHHGFDKTGDELIETVKDSTSGFTIVLAGLKSYLEHGINLRLIDDKFPPELLDH